jgi:hypothetical protein
VARILNEFAWITGDHRRDAIRLLSVPGAVAPVCKRFARFRFRAAETQDPLRPYAYTRRRSPRLRPLEAHGVSRVTYDIDLLSVGQSALEPAIWRALAADSIEVDIRHGDHEDPLLGVVRIAQSDQAI